MTLALRRQMQLLVRGPHPDRSAPGHSGAFPDLEPCGREPATVVTRVVGVASRGVDDRNKLVRAANLVVTFVEKNTQLHGSWTFCELIESLCERRGAPTGVEGLVRSARPERCTSASGGTQW